VLPGGTNSQARSLNEQGQVVGRSQVERCDNRAFLWTAAAGMISLGTIRDGSNAWEINAQTQVVGKHACGMTTAR